MSFGGSYGGFRVPHTSSVRSCFVLFRSWAAEVVPFGYVALPTSFTWTSACDLTFPERMVTLVNPARTTVVLLVPLITPPGPTRTTVPLEWTWIASTVTFLPIVILPPVAPVDVCSCVRAKNRKTDLAIM